MRSLPDPEQAKPCILVIDDDSSVAQALAARLGPDFRVVATCDPRQAVEVAKRERPDLILCDIHMPGMQGDEVAYALSQEPGTVRIPLAYLTSLVEPQDAEAELDGLFGDHPTISKAASPAELRARVAQVMGLVID